MPRPATESALPGPEGRRHGLVNKLRAYALQDQGLDTIDANSALGFDPDERFYQPAAAMLHQLGFTKIRLLTNNPDKLIALARHRVTVVERVPLVFPSNAHNEAYLRTKAVRSGHFLGRCLRPRRLARSRWRDEAVVGGTDALATPGAKPTLTARRESR